MIAALLLAAGSARRFGAPKLLEDVHGRPLIRWSAEALREIPLTELLVVVPPEHAALADALAGLRAHLVVNRDAALGMGTSLARGTDAVSAAPQALIVALADSPPDHDVLRRLVERYRDSGAAIVAPSYRGVFAPPVLFDRSVFEELRSLSGDRGARAVVERVPDRVAHVDVQAPAPADVDTPEDLARLRRDVHFTGTFTPRTPRTPRQP